MTLIASPDFLSSLSRLPGAWRFFPKQRIVCFRFFDCCLYSLKSETFTISKVRRYVDLFFSISFMALGSKPRERKK